MEDLKLHGLIGGGGSNIKSAQRGITTFTVATMTIDINTIDPQKSIIVAYTKGGYFNYLSNILVMAEIINANQIKLTRGKTGGSATVYWQVVEFNNVKSLQKGLKAYSSDNKITINTINPEKSIIVGSAFWDSDDEELASITAQYGFQINSATEIECFGGHLPTRYHWQVIEFN